MSQLFAPPPPAEPRDPPRRRRRWLPPIFLNPDTRSIEIGIAATILFHLLLLLFAPYLLRTAAGTSTVHRPPPLMPTFHIRINPESFLAPPKPKFVEANPNANHNIPNKTNNFAAQNQTVAQEKPTPNGKSDRPKLEGRKNFQSDQIVSGRLDKQPPAPQARPVPTSPPKPPVAAPRQAQSPLPGFEKLQSDKTDNFGSSDAKAAPSPKLTPEKVEGVKSAVPTPNATALFPQIDPNHPQPRPTLAQRTRPAIFAQNDVGTSNIGLTGIDARWSSYGEYLQRMIETIQIEWYKVLDSSNAQPPVGTEVSVRFRLNSDGRVTQLLKIDSTSSEVGKDACLAAITNPSPYGEWTPDMKATLGDHQDMTFTFYYIGE
jgi:hypothetical protein